MMVVIKLIAFIIVGLLLARIILGPSPRSRDLQPPEGEGWERNWWTPPGMWIRERHGIVEYALCTGRGYSFTRGKREHWCDFCLILDREKWVRPDRRELIWRRVK